MDNNHRTRFTLAALVAAGVATFTLAAPVAAAGSPIEPIDTVMVEAFLSTEGADSACSAYTAAGQLATIAGAPEHVAMMQDMAEAYLVVQFETIMSDELGGSRRLTDEGRDAYHLFLASC